MKIAGVVVLYNPDQEVIDNILTYLKDLDVLYTVDNSDYKNDTIVQRLKAMDKVIYLDNKGNKGIAHAQNRAARLALKSNYQWLLTMDQDGYAESNMVSILRNYIEEHDSSQIGIITAYQKNSRDKTNYFLQEFKQVLYTMSSGNIINLKAYEQVSGFENKLFIEMVDFDFCLKLNQRGFKIIVANKAILHHKLGDLQLIDNMIFHSHNPIRLYYYVRNELYVERKYKDIFPSWVSMRRDYCTKRYIKTLLYEKNKSKNLYYMIRGYIDFKRNRYGKL